MFIDRVVRLSGCDVIQRLRNLYEKWFLWHKRKRVYTSIRPDLGNDENTSSGFVEKSRPIKRNKWIDAEYGARKDTYWMP